MRNIETWLKSGRYLPEPLRDFHDQKAIFKAMHEMTNVKGHEFVKAVDWVTGQCYVIDIFLWWMARRGYTLQRTRTKAEFRDLAADVADQNRLRFSQLKTLLQPKDTQ